LLRCKAVAPNLRCPQAAVDRLDELAHAVGHAAARANGYHWALHTRGGSVSVFGTVKRSNPNTQVFEQTCSVPETLVRLCLFWHRRKGVRILTPRCK
jgi:hypothetical protein